MQYELISKRDLIKFIDKKIVPELLLHDNASGAGVMAGLSKALEETDVVPTIDAVPVVHARWIIEEISGRVDTLGKPDRRARCSACQFCWGDLYSVVNYFKHCPHCGTRMGVEGLVFWRDGEPQCKIKRSDFGFEWPVKEGKP